jgi:uncharacterized protein YkwD
MLKKMRAHTTLAVARNIALTLLFVSLLAATSFAQETFDAAGEKQLVELINQERAREGLDPLVVDERLTQAARKHTELLPKHKVLAHQFDGEESLQLRIADENLRSDRQAENVALEMSVAGAHANLMDSPPHRATILSSKYNAVGVGVLRSGDDIYVTEDFVHRVPDYSDQQADAVVQKTISQYAAAQGLPVPARKPQPTIHQMACDMALTDALDSGTPKSIAGVHQVVAWTASELEELPAGAKSLLSHPLSAGYSLGVCFAASVSYPGGIYWMVMVAY